MGNPADDALVAAFLTIAERQRRDRANKLLDEVDRLELLVGAELIRHEPIDFNRTDPDFGRALSTAVFLVPNIDPSMVDHVSFQPVRQDAHKRMIFIVFNKAAHRLAGSQTIVSEAAWVNAWTHVGS